MDLSGTTAIVTGAGGGGSGRAIARRLAREGAVVLVADVDERGGRETVEQIERERGRAHFFRADVGVEADVTALVDCAVQNHGGLDVLVNNAGGTFYPEVLGHWMETLQPNLLGTMYGTLHAVAAMRGRGGAIVNMSSTSALGYGPSKSPAYDAAKAAVVRLTAALACLREQLGIRVNCLAPHWIATEEIKAFLAQTTPEQRQAWRVPDVLLSPDDVADAVVRLATDEQLAGRVLVWWGGQPRRLIAAADPGFAQLEAI